MKRYVVLALALLVSLPALAVPTTLSTVNVSEAAAALADNAADTANGNRIKNPSCDLVLVVRNTDAADSATVTVAAQGTSINIPGYGTMTKSNLAISLAAGAVKHVGPFACRTWNDSSGYVQLTYSGTGAAAVKVTPLRVPK